MAAENFIQKKSRYLKGFEKSMARAACLIISHYGAEQAKKIMHESRREFENLIPQLPDIGNKNPMLTDHQPKFTQLKR